VIGGFQLGLLGGVARRSSPGCIFASTLRGWTGAGSRTRPPELREGLVRVNDAELRLLEAVRSSIREQGRRAVEPAGRCGGFVPNTGGKWITPPPSRCLNGHTLGPGEVLVGHQACLGHGGGHTTWTCRQCDATVYGPPLNTQCTTLEGPAPARISNSDASSRHDPRVPGE